MTSGEDSAAGRKDLTETYHNYANHLQPGSFVGPRYKIVKLLGVGGMGRVYLARDEELDIDVALKLIRPELLSDEGAVERFKNELILARKVSHRNVARIHDLGEIDGLKFLTMTYIPGDTLRDVIRDNGPFPVDRAVAIMTQITEAVSSAHEEGVIHRDLKPGNILLDQSDRVYVTDFGIARSLDAADQTGTGVLLGTPAYLSPEQTWGKKADTSSDIYALGLILYEMLAGKLPFDHTTAHAFRTKLPADLDSTIKRLQPEIPGYLMDLLRKCLHPNKDLRYQTAPSVLQDLHRKQVQVPFSDSVTTRRLAIGVLILVLIIGAFLAKQRWTRNNQSKNAPPIADIHQGTIKSVLVLPFSNKTTGQELRWIDSGMTDMLIADLAQAPNLRVISSERMYQTLEDLKMAGPEYSAEEIKRLSELLNADWIVKGILMQAGDGLRADTKLTERENPQNPVYVKAAGSRAEDVLKISVQLARQIQTHLEASTGKDEGSPETESLESSRSFHEGLDWFRQSEFEKAVPSFQQAIREDSKYGRAYLKLSEAYEASGKFDLALQILEQGLSVLDPGETRIRHQLLAQQALLQGELEKGINLYQEISRKYPNDSEVLFKLALACQDVGDLKQAVVALEKLLRLDPNHPEAYFHLGKDTILMGDAEKAISQYLLKARSIHTRLNNKYGEADVLNAIGVGYERLGRYDDAIKHYQDSILIKEQIGNKKGIATSVSNIAKIYIFEGEHPKAKEYLNNAYSIFEELQDRKGIADTINQFGVISEDQGQYTEALSQYKKALQIRKDLGDDQLTAQSYDNIGHIYHLQGKYDDAQVFWEQSLNLRRSIGEESGIILSLQNMGFLQIAQGQLDHALSSFLEALNQSRAIQYENAIAVSLGNLGFIYQMQGRYPAALDSYKEAIEVLERLKDKKGIAEYTKLEGSVYLDLNMPQAATDKLNVALKTAQDIQSAEIVVDTQILLARGRRLQADISGAEELLNAAQRTAVSHSFEKSLLQASVEKAWLSLARKENPSTFLEKEAKKAEERRDPWLQLALLQALAVSRMENGERLASLKTSERGMILARKVKSRPFQFRFYSLAGQASLSLNSKEQAAKYFEEAKLALQEIQKSLNPEQVSNLLKTPEARAIL